MPILSINYSLELLIVLQVFFVCFKLTFEAQKLRFSLVYVLPPQLLGKQCSNTSTSNFKNVANRVRVLGGKPNIHMFSNQIYMCFLPKEDTLYTRGRAGDLER